MAAKTAVNKALRQKRNELSSVYFAAGCLAMIALFAIFKLVGKLVLQGSKKKGVFTKVSLSTTRYDYPLSCTLLLIPETDESEALLSDKYLASRVLDM